MPVISRFFGIVVTMYYADHDPPHMHVRYGGDNAIVSLEDAKVIAGTLSPRAAAMVFEWAMRHRTGLSENWQRARAAQPLLPIAPLE
jgi:hypothetical protein